jgi:hypothetical protein
MNFKITIDLESDDLFLMTSAYSGKTMDFRAALQEVDVIYSIIPILYTVKCDHEGYLMVEGQRVIGNGMGRYEL